MQVCLYKGWIGCVLSGGCLFFVQQKLYKVLSEVKGEVETVIKTGRQIVQRQQTEQPKEMDDRVTALKLLYNQLGAQVRAHPNNHNGLIRMRGIFQRFSLSR